jgi:hypothetical protein
MMRQAGLTEEVFQKTEDECKGAWVQARDNFVLFRENLAKVADEHRKQLSKLIAAHNDTGPDVKCCKLTHHICQRKFGLKLRQITKKVKKVFVQKFVFDDTTTGVDINHS